MAKFVRPFISLSCCVTFLRATYAFKCCSQIARRKRGNPPSPVRLHKKINPETGQVQNYNPISCALGQPVSRCAILHDVLHAVHKNPRCKAPD